MTELGVRLVTDTSINKAVGAEIRRAREGLGLTREQLVARMSSDISPVSIGNYEYGVRPCTMPRLAEICEALGVPMSVLVALALQRAGVEPEPGSMYVALTLILEDAQDFPNADLRNGVRMWARRRWSADRDIATVVVSKGGIDELAIFFGVTSAELRKYLRRFTPPRTPCWITWEGHI